MCVIIFKPKGVAMPSNDIINACARANRDGFGFCTPNKFYKSTSFEKFKSELKAVEKDEPCIMHFRLATHGKVSKTNCHPFKQGDVYFAHNGVLSITPYAGRTDSETAFLKYIYPAIQKGGLHSSDTDTAVYETIESSRFAIMQGEDVRLFGEFLQNEGCFYSNFRFAHYLYR